MSTYPESSSAPLTGEVFTNSGTESAQDWASSTQNALKQQAANVEGSALEPPAGTIIHTRTVTTTTTPASTAFQGTTGSSTEPGAQAGIIGSTSDLDASAKSQSEVDKFLAGNQSAVSTPGNELPGAWKEPAATAGTAVTGTLASIGTAAYNVLPDSIKNTFSAAPNTTSNSPITTTTNTHAGPTASEKLSQTASNAAQSTQQTASSAAATTYNAAADATNRAAPVVNNAAGQTYETASNVAGQAYDTAGNVAGSAYETAGSAAGQVYETAAALAATATGAAGVAYEKAKETYSANAPAVLGGETTTHPTGTTAIAPKHDTSVTTHPIATLPSEEITGIEGQHIHGPVGGVGALPGRLDETGVAILPDEKTAPAVSDQQSNVLSEASHPTSHSTTAGNVLSEASAPTSYPTSHSTTAPDSATKNESLAAPYSGSGATAGNAAPRPTDTSSTAKPATAKVADAVGAHSTADKIEERKEPRSTHDHEQATTGPSTTEKVKEKVTPSHSSTTEPSSTASHSTAAHSSTTAHDGDNLSHTTSTDSAGSPKKVGFMQKLKGEVKILTGKMGHNDAKVQEGVALKTGEH